MELEETVRELRVAMADHAVDTTLIVGACGTMIRTAVLPTR